MDVFIVPCLEDNYAYILRCKATGKTAVVDPVTLDNILMELDRIKTDIKDVDFILTTHKHWDHAGGNIALKAKIAHANVVGGKGDDVPGCTMTVDEGNTFKIGQLNVRILHTPCHTIGHVLYVVSDGKEQIVFTGDTLFIGGCGRFFEGTAIQMHDALMIKVKSLRPDTKVYCGHEYTINNLSFSKAVEPNNADIDKKKQWAIAKRAENKPTVPSTIGEELKYNPFMRCDQPDVIAYCNVTDKTDHINVMKVLRAKKDNFGLGAGHL